MARKLRVDSTTEQVRLAAAGVKAIKPLAHAPIDDDAEPFWADNRIARCGQQCIDLLDALGFAISGNDCSGAVVAAAISVKGGSRPPPLGSAIITQNTIHDQKGKTIAAIEVGGFGDLAADGAMLHTRPSLAHGPAAYGVSVWRNTTRAIEGPSLVICGAESCSASGNAFARAILAPWEIGCQPDNRGCPPSASPPTPTQAPGSGQEAAEPGERPARLRRRLTGGRRSPLASVGRGRCST